MALSVTTESSSNHIQVAHSPASSTWYTVTLPQLRHPQTSISSFMDEGKMLSLNVSKVKVIAMRKPNQTENFAAPVKLPCVHSQLELGSLPGLLTHMFPNLHSRQAFYDGLATRYFPDLADARSSLQYLGLVHRSV